MDPNWQLGFLAPITNYIHNITFMEKASLVMHSIKQTEPYGVINIFKDYISYQQVLKFHTMLKLHGEQFHRFVRITGHHNQ